MNPKILHKEVQEFIHAHLKSDLTRLILKGSPFKDVAIQEIAEQVVAKQKSEKKLPSWYETSQIYYPPKINIEQTSSEQTAGYKASLVSGRFLLDMTGGFGVDSKAFSERFQQVTHCEINEELSRITQHNFRQFEIENIEFIQANAIEYLRNTSQKFDCIYIDPSRRNDLKEKVFLLEDCEPNIPSHLDLLLTYTSTVLLKTSPILDISSALNELKFVKEIHIVAWQNEVKELLFLIQKDSKNPPQIITCNFQGAQVQKFSFVFQSQATSEYSFPKKFLFEPNGAILKSGGFHHVSSQFNIKKLHPHSHLYTSDDLVDFPGRRFHILNILPYDRKKIKEALKQTKANIATRNFPKSVQQIRKELKIKDGGSQYLFFTKDLNEQYCCISCIKA